MPREIKFQFYDENLGQMNEVCKIEFNNRYGLQIFSSIWDDEPCTLNDGHLREYTGLNDKNSKEIYEGDILDCSYINPMSQETLKRHFEVVFKNGYFSAKLIGQSPYGDTWLYFEAGKGEVIGNIYENPELLEG